MADLLAVHRGHLERQRSVMNLVGPGDVGFHYRDCEAALAWMAPQGTWADLGSGAGFPGIVLAALFPALTVHLVESRRKRCVFLEQVLLEGGIRADRAAVRCQRVEDLEDGQYDGVVARAFAAPEAVLNVASRLLHSGGQVVLFLQDHAEVDVPSAFTVFHVERYTVDGRRRRAMALRFGSA